VPANEVDDARVAAVQADALLTGAKVQREPGKLQTSVDADFQRAEVSGSAAIGGTGNAWTQAHTLADNLAADQWKFTAVECDAGGSIEFYALKDYGEFTAAMTAESDGPQWSWRVYIPFHAETGNPWNPSRTVDAGTCLDAEEPLAASNDSQLPDHNYSAFGVCDPRGC
jgi:hypothetical protein